MTRSIAWDKVTHADVLRGVRLAIASVRSCCFSLNLARLLAGPSEAPFEAECLHFRLQNPRLVAWPGNRIPPERGNERLPGLDSNQQPSG